MDERFCILNGYLIKFKKVRGSNFLEGEESEVWSATLESARDAVGNLIDSSADDASKQLNAFKQVWSTLASERTQLTPSTLSDIAQISAIGYIKRTSDLIDSSNLLGPPTPSETFHKTSNINVLPPRFNEAWKALTSTVTGVETERGRTIIKALEGSFKDYRLHETTEAAYAAYNEWILRGQGDAATKEAREGYLVNG